MAVKIFIDGQAGTTGLRIHERLADRNDLTMITLTEETRKDPEARRAAILESIHPERFHLRVEIIRFCHPCID